MAKKTIANPGVRFFRTNAAGKLILSAHATGDHDTDLHIMAAFGYGPDRPFQPGRINLFGKKRRRIVRRIWAMDWPYELQLVISRENDGSQTAQLSIIGPANFALNGEAVTEKDGKFPATYWGWKLRFNPDGTVAEESDDGLPPICPWFTKDDKPFARLNNEPKAAGPDIFAMLTRENERATGQDRLPYTRGVPIIVWSVPDKESRTGFSYCVKGESDDDPFQPVVVSPDSPDFVEFLQRNPGLSVDFEDDKEDDGTSVVAMSISGRIEHAPTDGNGFLYHPWAFDEAYRRETSNTLVISILEVDFGVMSCSAELIHRKTVEASLKASQEGLGLIVDLGLFNSEAFNKALTPKKMRALALEGALHSKDGE